MMQKSLLACRPGPAGVGVFALRAIEPGRRLLEFTGPVLDRKALDAALACATVDSYLQIATDSYMGPSGAMDDFINHSCDPNCGLRFSRSRIVLTAIRPIEPDEEITFDYATTQNAYPYRFSCSCDSSNCRHDIGDFDDLPSSLKRKYYELGVLAPYLAATLTSRADSVASASMDAKKPVGKRQILLT